MPEETREAASRANLCDHPQCSCVINDAEAIRQDGKRYCSRGCAEGFGCEHEACQCVDEEKTP